MCCSPLSRTSCGNGDGESQFTKREGINRETKYARPDRGQAARSEREDQRARWEGDEQPRFGSLRESGKERWQSSKMDRQR